MSKDSRIEDRVKRLERANRLLLAAMLVFVVGILAMGAGSGSNESSEVVSAEAFHLVDPRGTVMAALELGAEGPGLVIRDADGRDRVRLTHEAEQSGLFILDDSGHSRVGIAQFSHGGGGVALHGPGAKGAAVLYFKGNGTLSFYDADGNVVYRAPQD